MTMSALQKKIKLKFGSYHNFARLVGMSTLKGKSPAEIDKIATRLSRSGAGGTIPKEKLQALTERLKMFPGGVAEFCNVHDYSEVSVYQIIQGRRKRMSPVVERLFNQFGI
jgi:hypothetical protein